MYYFHPFRLAKSLTAKQNLSHRANVICDGSPSRIRRVRRISLGMTTRPRSSIRRTIPVAFMLFQTFLVNYLVFRAGAVRKTTEPAKCACAPAVSFSYKFICCHYYPHLAPAYSAYKNVVCFGKFRYEMQSARCGRQQALRFAHTACI